MNFAKEVLEFPGFKFFISKTKEESFLVDGSLSSFEQASDWFKRRILMVGSSETKFWAEQVLLSKQTIHFRTKKKLQ